MWQSVRALVFKPGFLLAVYIGSAVFVSVQLIAEGSHLFAWPQNAAPADIMNRPELMNLFWGQRLTEYNNYLIFKYSFFHLLHGTNLYGIYPTQHWDFYKYSPTFALFMGLFAYLPNLAGLMIWNILNVAVVFFSIRMLPFKTKTQCLLLWFMVNDMLTCLANTQSNGLMCGLMIAAYGFMEHKKLTWAVLCLVIATYIKVYGAIGFCLFLFYPGKVKFVLCAAMWTVILFALPLMVTPLPTLLWQYHNWASLLAADASAALGLSVTGWLHSWFGINNSKTYVTVIGLLLFIIPFVRWRLYQNELYKLLTLASMLIWVIIFNHKAESSTYIIAVAGAGIWYFAMPAAKWRTALLFFVLVFTCLGTTDLFPESFKSAFIRPYKIKAFPCIIVWCVVWVELMIMKGNERLQRVEEKRTIAA